jgi:hypothetical protein
MNTTKTTLKFFYAIANKQINFWSSGRIAQKGARMYVAKFGENFVVAFTQDSFFILSAKEAAEYVTTTRENGQPVVATYKVPQIDPTGERFHWKVECGSTCPDGCCGDDCPTFSQKVSGKAEAEKLAKTMAGKYTGAFSFVRVQGPAFYSYQRRNENGQFGA